VKTRLIFGEPKLNVHDWLPVGAQLVLSQLPWLLLLTDPFILWPVVVVMLTRLTGLLLQHYFYPDTMSAHRCQAKALYLFRTLLTLLISFIALWPLPAAFRG